MNKKTKNFFILSLILIAIASLIYFKPVRNSAIQYPNYGESSSWIEYPTYTQGKLHIVGLTSADKISQCFNNLDGTLYESASIQNFQPDYSDERSCPNNYFPKVIKFYVSENNNPCVTIADKNTEECYTTYTDEEVSLDDSISRKRYQCLVNSGSYGCAISDVQVNSFILNKKQTTEIPPLPPETPSQPTDKNFPPPDIPSISEPEPQQPETTPTQTPLILILGLLSGLSILGVLLYLKTKKR